MGIHCEICSFQTTGSSAQYLCIEGEEGSAKSVRVRTKEEGIYCQYVRTQYNYTNASNSSKNPVVFLTHIYSNQHADIVSGCELENMGQTKRMSRSHNMIVILLSLC